MLRVRTGGWGVAVRVVIEPCKSETRQGTLNDRSLEGMTFPFV